MKTIKTYDQFVNEEFNWKTGIVKLLLMGTLIGTFSSCCNCSDRNIVAYNISQNQPLTKTEFSVRGKIMTSRYISVRRGRYHHDYYTKLIIKCDDGIVYLIVIDGDYEKELQKNDEVTIVFIGGYKGYVYKGQKSYKIEPLELTRKSGTAGENVNKLIHNL